MLLRAQKSYYLVILSLYASHNFFLYLLSCKRLSNVAVRSKLDGFKDLCLIAFGRDHDD